ncbi:DPY30 domain containing 2 isoform X1 [Trichomycterus rosablanca]|uniref:DPY30 domain containing 2 isoform X1 n=1 Tax=Trichomycterus rosablanca TaxID=2290929 RepID=UPI002F35BED7
MCVCVCVCVCVSCLCVHLQDDPGFESAVEVADVDRASSRAAIEGDQRPEEPETEPTQRESDQSKPLNEDDAASKTAEDTQINPKDSVTETQPNQSHPDEEDSDGSKMDPDVGNANNTVEDPEESMTKTKPDPASHAEEEFQLSTDSEGLKPSDRFSMVPENQDDLTVNPERSVIETQPSESQPEEGEDSKPLDVNGPEDPEESVIQTHLSQPDQEQADDDPAPTISRPAEIFAEQEPADLKPPAMLQEEGEDGGDN